MHILASISPVVIAGFILVIWFLLSRRKPMNAFTRFLGTPGVQVGVGILFVTAVAIGGWIYLGPGASKSGNSYQQNIGNGGTGIQINGGNTTIQTVPTPSPSWHIGPWVVERTTLFHADATAVWGTQNNPDNPTEQITSSTDPSIRDLPVYEYTAPLTFIDDSGIRQAWVIVYGDDIKNLSPMAVAILSGDVVMGKGCAYFNLVSSGSITLGTGYFLVVVRAYALTPTVDVLMQQEPKRISPC